MEAERNKLTIMHDFAIQPKTLREAWEQGLQQGLIQVALNMLREDIDLALVAKLTGLPLERVKGLQVSNLDDSQSLVKDFLELSESSLNKVWLDPEEDKAWKDL
ncbi:hypothetical protein [Nostoc sp. MG11]|jgi:hypothetical protein|uniref:hypothetical protein n=1 Tax=Nostoc sp. MG11 TaxID=2721166 RepID=UPI001D00BFA5|nr:hypothetical protein [Nostoc sp. MG11]